MGFKFKVRKNVEYVQFLLCLLFNLAIFLYSDPFQVNVSDVNGGNNPSNIVDVNAYEYGFVDIVLYVTYLIHNSCLHLKYTEYENFNGFSIELNVPASSAPHRPPRIVRASSAHRPRSLQKAGTKDRPH